MVAVARYWPRGNTPGKASINVRPPISLHAVQLPTISRTREEANFHVRNALVTPDVPPGIVKHVRTHHKSPSYRPKENGVLPNKRKSLKKKSRPSSSFLPCLCGKGRRLSSCCSVAPLNPSEYEMEGATATPPVSARPQDLNIIPTASMVLDDVGKDKICEPPEFLSAAALLDSRTRDRRHQLGIPLGTRPERPVSGVDDSRASVTHVDYRRALSANSSRQTVPRGILKSAGMHRTVNVMPKTEEGAISIVSHLDKS